MIISICIYISPYIWMYIFRIVLNIWIYSCWGLGRGKSSFRDWAKSIRSLEYFLLPMGVSIKAIKVCTFSIGVKVWMFSLFMGYLDL